jgi:hypothetical protein
MKLKPLSFVWFIFWPHCKARSTLWHFKRQDWHFDYHLPMQSYRCLWLSYPISRQKRLKKSPRLTYNYNHIIACHINEHRPAILIGACYFHLSLSPSTNLFGSLVGNLHAWHLSNWAWASCLSFPFELLFLYYSSGWHISVSQLGVNKGTPLPACHPDHRTQSILLMRFPSSI